MNKNITFFDGTLEKGGAERVISILSKKFIESGYRVEILLYYNRDIYYSIDKRVKITTIQGETGSTSIIQNLIWMRKYFKEKETILISFLAPFNMFALFATLGMRLPIIVADRNDPRRVPERLLLRKARDLLYRFSNCVVVQTDHNKQYFEKALFPRTEIIFNPVDVGAFIGVGLITEKKKKIVNVGRLMKQKNQKMLINAFNSIRKQFPEYELYIYGEGPERESLEYQISMLGLDKSVHLMGQVDDVYTSIIDAELFVLSSYYEGMPNALIEAMCLGLPVISTDVSGATDLINQKENGILTKCGDEKQLSDAISQMLCDTIFRNKCAEKAVEVAERLNADSILGEWIMLIKEISDEH